jgi:hypothetical protein
LPSSSNQAWMHRTRAVFLFARRAAIPYIAEACAVDGAFADTNPSQNPNIVKSKNIVQQLCKHIAKLGHAYPHDPPNGTLDLLLGYFGGTPGYPGVMGYTGGTSGVSAVHSKGEYR